jgi:hypothetical protein
MSKELTAERLREVLHYDPETGVFLWRAALSSKTVPGTRAGQLKPSGYRYIGLFGGRYPEHRLAYLYTEGNWPDDEVDHLNLVKDDNRYKNLRPCSHAENHQNRGLSRANQSGIVGVGWHKLRGRWRSCITVGGKQCHLGLFDSPDEAHAAYLSAKARLHTFQPTPRTQ